MRGYNNVFMSENSRTMLGFQWAGHYFVCNTIPFGWRSSAYVYDRLNLHAISYLRRQSITSLLYIDDRMLGEYADEVPQHLDNPLSRSKIAIHVAVKLFVCLGYFLNISKSVLFPTQVLIFLGMIVNSVERSFFITDKRKQKLRHIRESILGCTVTTLLTVQKFTGLCISMILAIPAAKLYTTACNKAISWATLHRSYIIPVQDDLREEVLYWQFLDDWTKPFPWLSERHISIQLSTDSSNYKWAAILHADNGDVVSSDIWSNEDRSLPIMLKEALALKNALICFRTEISGKRVKALVDNKSVCFAWSNQTSRNSHLNRVLKDIFTLTLELNCSLDIVYIPSKLNPSDLPSRSLSKVDATLTYRTWLYVQFLFGPHTVDIFSLDSNAMTNPAGEKLRHFTPFPSPQSSGVDAFAQTYTSDERYFAFPPFCLLPGFIKLIIQERINVTLLFPLDDLFEPWHVLIMTYAHIIFPVGYKGDKSVLLYPTKKGYQWDKLGLPWNLMAAKFDFSTYEGKFIQLHRVTRPINLTPTLFLGDSMIRFITNLYEDTHVISVGGAKLLDSLDCLTTEIQGRNTFVVLFHSGTNNVNKTYYPEDAQIRKAKQSLGEMESIIPRLQSRYAFSFVYSGCIYTRSTVINKRIDMLNEAIRLMCSRCSFTFIDHSNISSDMLRDEVHLNKHGENVMLQNLRGLL